MLIILLNQNILTFFKGANQVTGETPVLGRIQCAGAASVVGIQQQMVPPPFSFTPQPTATPPVPNTLSFGSAPPPAFSQPTVGSGPRQHALSSPVVESVSTPVANSSGISFGQANRPVGEISLGQPPSSSTSECLNFAQNSGSNGQFFDSTPISPTGRVSFGQLAGATPTTATAPPAFEIYQPFATTLASSSLSSTGFTLTQPERAFTAETDFGQAAPPAVQLGERPTGLYLEASSTTTAPAASAAPFGLG